MTQAPGALYAAILDALDPAEVVDQLAALAAGKVAVSLISLPSNARASLI
jgi:hypothetical protein